MYARTSSLRGFGRARRLGQIPYSTAADLTKQYFTPPWWTNVIPGGPAMYETKQAWNLVVGPSGDIAIASLPNATTGQLTPAQIQALQDQAVGQNNAVLQNAQSAYGVDSPAVAAIAGVLPAQNTATVADISGVNVQSSDPLLNATGIPWYLWAAGGLALYLAVR
jgi:hypothetical protein